MDIWKTQEDNVATDEHEIPETETESLPRWAQKIMANIRGKEDDANRNKISKLVREYNAYKKSKLQNFRFNPVKASSQFSDISLIYSRLSFCKGEEQPPSNLRLVQIYFDTATFDEIERDEKVKFTAALSLVGGTMGLLTGFSIISGIELVFFLVKLVSPLVVNFVKQKVENIKRRFVST